ncbi:hypothetical protein GQ53DRAFT_835342 [Thozetella sp. PMI_491]|nr:hypothetical protein GQ53DRAFT_835342 [Thozetella sp. PMI_491]
MVGIASPIISQSKWDWFTGQYRPLQHLQAFSDGSRGGLGAAQLLLVVKGISVIPTATVLLMLASFAIGPFVQQSIGTTPCSIPIPGISASLPYGHYVPRHAEWTRPINAGPAWDADTDTMVAVYSVLADPTSVSNQNVTVTSWTTGNCTFTSGDPPEAMFTSFQPVENSTFTTIGVCSSCADVTGLVSGRGDSNGQYTYQLPNGLQIYYPREGTWLNLTTDRDLRWTGASLPPDIVQMPRWSFANVAVLTTSTAGCDDPKAHISWAPARHGCTGPGTSPGEMANTTISVIVATCALFPCMKTYNVSVSSSNVTETLPFSAATLPDVSNLASTPMSSDSIENINAEHNSGFDYAGVHSPCRVGNVIYTYNNFSAAPNVTRLSLFQNLPNAPLYNVSAPERCIYRHSAGWGVAVSRLFQQLIFRGYCRESRALPSTLDCVSVSQSGDELPDFGNGKYMSMLYADGNATAPNIEALFQAFATGVTTKYRTIFGSDFRLNASFGPEDWLPQGKANGAVMQTTTCVKWNWQWLLLPSLLVTLLSILLSIFIVNTWRQHHVQPVWKDSILPVILYREQFEDAGGARLATALHAEDVAMQNTRIGLMSDIMEIDEIEKLAGTVQVQFVWSDFSRPQVERAGYSG